MKKSKIWKPKNRIREERMIPSMELNIMKQVLLTLKWVVLQRH